MVEGGGRHGGPLNQDRDERRRFLDPRSWFDLISTALIRSGIIDARRGRGIGEGARRVASSPTSDARRSVGLRLRRDRVGGSRRDPAVESASTDSVQRRP
jgi:hypothetical protein